MNKNERRSFRRGAVVQIAASCAATMRDGTQEDLTVAVVTFAERLTAMLEAMEESEDTTEREAKRHAEAKAADAKSGAETVEPH